MGIKICKIFGVGIFAVISLFCMSGQISAEELKNSTPTPKPPVEVQIPNRIVNTSDRMYSYDDYSQDIGEIARCFPSVAKKEVIGTSYDNRNIYSLIVGNPKAKRQVMIVSTIHAREWLNTMFLMEKVEYLCRNYNKATYKGKKLASILRDKCLVLVPMVNPDGVTISQYGPKGIHNAILRKRLKKLPGIRKYKLWKANARGVDINRNFARGWGRGVAHRAGSENFCGKWPISEKESQALCNYTWTWPNIQVIISYHSMGEIIYYNYGAKKSLQKKINNYAKKIRSLTKYHLLWGSRMKKGDGGFGEWCVYFRKVPSVTPETGTGGCPLKFSQYNRLRNKNKWVLEEMLASN